MMPGEPIINIVFGWGARSKNLDSSRCMTTASISASARLVRKLRKSGEAGSGVKKSVPSGLSRLKSEIVYHGIYGYFFIILETTGLWVIEQ